MADCARKGRGNKNEIRKEICLCGEKTRYLSSAGRIATFKQISGLPCGNICPVLLRIKPWPPNERTILATPSRRPEASGRRDDPFRKVPALPSGSAAVDGRLQTSGCSSPGRAGPFTPSPSRHAPAWLRVDIVDHPGMLLPVCSMPRRRLLGLRRKASLRFPFVTRVSELLDSCNPVSRVSVGLLLTVRLSPKESCTDTYCEH